MSAPSQIVPWRFGKEAFARLTAQPYRLEFDKKRHALVSYDEGKKVFDYLLPPLWPSPNPGEYPEGYFARIPADFPSYVLILIQAGQAALGYFPQGKLQEHKVIRRYMVRKKSGKAQLTHLKTKGKSRYGSRLRLQESFLFFEDIHNKLNDWQRIPQSQRILLSCTKTLKPYLFSADVPHAFEAEDEKLLSVPITVKTPNLEELQRVSRQMGCGKLIKHQDFDENFDFFNR